MTNTEAAICARVLMGITRVAIRAAERAEVDLRFTKIDAKTCHTRVAAAMEMHTIIGRLQAAMFDCACLGELGGSKNA